MRQHAWTPKTGAHLWADEVERLITFRTSAVAARREVSTMLVYTGSLNTTINPSPNVAYLRQPSASNPTKPWRALHARIADTPKPRVLDGDDGLGQSRTALAAARCG
jgi:hypothetical protein